MAASSEDSEDDFVVLGTPVPEIEEGQPLKKPVNIQDLAAKDKKGRQRFHGAFTGGFSAGYFNSVGTKEGFTPSTFVSSRSQKNEETRNANPEDFMDEEDFEEHGIAPRKFATASTYTSEQRKRKLHEDVGKITAKSSIDLGSTLVDLIVLDRFSIGIKLLNKMGWREGQGLGPRIKKKKKRGQKVPQKGVKIYGCPLPPSDGNDSDSDQYVPEDISEVTFAPQDVSPISLVAKDNVHGLGYHGLDPSLALPGSHINLLDTTPSNSYARKKGIRGQAFGVGVFEDEDEDIYAEEDMSQYNITMDSGTSTDPNFGWTAPKDHGKQPVPASYIGKLLDGFCLSSKQLKPIKKFPPPTLPRHFKPQHWFRKKRITSHLAEDTVSADGSESGSLSRQMTAVDRGLILGEKPIMGSVFDLIPASDKSRLESTKESIALTQSLMRKKEHSSEIATVQAATETMQSGGSLQAQLETRKKMDTAHQKESLFLSMFQPAEPTPPEKSSTSAAGTCSSTPKIPLFQGSLSFQPFRKDPAKQERYDKYLALVKQGVKDPYSSVVSANLTEWEKSRERDEFAKTAKMFRPLSAMMSSRFVRGSMIDDDVTEQPKTIEDQKSDESKAADMNMFGKLTREEVEWHPDKLLCRRFNVPNPYPGSEIVGLTTVKRDKYSVFNFLTFGDYQQGETQEAPPQASADKESIEPVPLSGLPSKKKTLASVFKVLDEPDFHNPSASRPDSSKSKEDDSILTSDAGANGEGDENEVEDSPPDMDLFRAIFKNSDSEDSDESQDPDDDDDDDDDKEQNEEEKSSESVENVSLVAGDEEQKESHSPGLEGVSNSQAESLEKTPNNPLSSRSCDQPGQLGSVEDAYSSIQRDPGVKYKLGRSRWDSKSVFSVLDDLDGENKEVAPSEVPLKARLASALFVSESPEEVDEYGPCLPPGLTSTPARSFSASVKPVEGKAFRQEYDKDVRDVDSRTKRHKHRKDKKRKSKHKKVKKSKKHKKKSSRSSGSKQKSSGSEADTESSDNSD